MSYMHRFANIVHTALFDSKVPEAVRASLTKAMHADEQSRREALAKLHQLHDGQHRDIVHEAATALYNQRADVWYANGTYAGYQFVPYVSTMCDRLAVAFHTPPDLYLYDPDDTERTPITEGPEAEQLRRDIETGAIDTTLTQLERLVTCLRQEIVWPRYLRDTDTIKWTLMAPYDVWAVPNRFDTTDIQRAEAVTFLLAARDVDQLGGRTQTHVTFTREGDINPTWRMYYTEDGKVLDNPLFPDDINRYGMYPFVMWQTADPVSGELWLPPNEDWLQRHVGLCLQATDLAHGARYQAHATPVYRGTDPEDEGQAVLGPGIAQHLPDTDMDFDWKAPPVEGLRMVRELMDFELRIGAVSESMDPETWTPGGATRNLAAMQQRSADKRLRRTAVVPHYRRLLAETWKRHKAVNDHAVDVGWSRTRVRYGDLALGVKFAPIPVVEDRLQGVQATIAEIGAGLTDEAAVIMKRDGVDRVEAERRAALYAKNKPKTEPTEPPPVPTDPEPGGGERPPSVRE